MSTTVNRSNWLNYKDALWLLGGVRVDLSVPGNLHEKAGQI